MLFPGEILSYVKNVAPIFLVNWGRDIDPAWKYIKLLLHRNFVGMIWYVKYMINMLSLIIYGIGFVWFYYVFFAFKFSVCILKITHRYQFEQNKTK